MPNVKKVAHFILYENPHLEYWKSHFGEISIFGITLTMKMNENVHSCLTVMFHKSLDPVWRHSAFSSVGDKMVSLHDQ